MNKLDLKDISTLEKNKLITFIKKFVIESENETIIVNKSQLVQLFSKELNKKVLENNNVDKFLIDVVDSIEDKFKMKVIEKFVNNESNSWLCNENYQRVINNYSIDIGEIANNKLSEVDKNSFISTINQIDLDFKSIKGNKQFLTVTGGTNVTNKFKEGEKLINKYLELIYTYKISRTKIQNLFLDYSLIRDVIKKDFLEIKQILDFIDDEKIDASIGRDVTYLDIEKFEGEVIFEYDKLRQNLTQFNNFLDKSIDGVAENFTKSLEKKFNKYSKRAISSSEFKNDAIGVGVDLAVDMFLAVKSSRMESKKTLALLEKDIEIIKNKFTIDLSNLLDDFYRLYEIYRDVKENYIVSALQFHKYLTGYINTELKDLTDIINESDLKLLWKNRSEIISKIKFLKIEIDSTSKVLKSKSEIFKYLDETNSKIINENNLLLQKMNTKPSLLDFVLSFGMYHFVYNTSLKKNIINIITEYSNFNNGLQIEINEAKLDFEIHNEYFIKISNDLKKSEEALLIINQEIFDRINKIRKQINVDDLVLKIKNTEELFNNILKVDISKELKAPESYRESLNYISNYKIISKEETENFQYKNKYVQMYSMIENLKNNTIREMGNQIYNLKELEKIGLDNKVIENLEEGYIKQGLELIIKVECAEDAEVELEEKLNFEVQKFVHSKIAFLTSDFSHLDNYDQHVMKATNMFINYFSNLNTILKDKEITSYFKNANELNYSLLNERKGVLDKKINNKYLK